MNIEKVLLVPVNQMLKPKVTIPYFFVLQIIFIGMKIYGVIGNIQALSWPWILVFTPMWILPALFIVGIVIAVVAALLGFFGLYIYYSIGDLQRKKRVKKHDKT